MTTSISSRNQPTKAKLVQNLKVLDLDKNECTVLTQCFSIKSLPVSNSEIPSKVDLSNLVTWMELLCQILTQMSDY